MVNANHQLSFMEAEVPDTFISDKSSTTFVDNMKLPVHRWFRYSAGFSAQWAQATIQHYVGPHPPAVLDPFAGSGTTMIAAEREGVPSTGVEAHPFVMRVARAKLLYRDDPNAFVAHARRVESLARDVAADTGHYPSLIERCYSSGNLDELDRLRRAWEELDDQSAGSTLSWLALVSILRSTSGAGTAPWQYILPNKTKKSPLAPFQAFSSMVAAMRFDMIRSATEASPRARMFEGDARTLTDVSTDSIDLVITSPPYPNNYDYADSTRLEMSFFGEVSGWGDLQEVVRRHLVRSCSHHMREKHDDITELVENPSVEPIKDELRDICVRMANERDHHGGRKNYHLMVAAYFADMARTWDALRRVCKSESEIVFVIGDSAPYGVYVPVMEWNIKLAERAGFTGASFEKTRDRNVKWRNRKHRVPLCEGRLRLVG